MQAAQHGRSVFGVDALYPPLEQVFYIVRRAIDQSERLVEADSLSQQVTIPDAVGAQFGDDPEALLAVDQGAFGGHLLSDVTQHRQADAAAVQFECVAADRHLHERAVAFAVLPDGGARLIRAQVGQLGQQRVALLRRADVEDGHGPQLVERVLMDATGGRVGVQDAQRLQLEDEHGQRHAFEEQLEARFVGAHDVLGPMVVGQVLDDGDREERTLVLL